MRILIIPLLLIMLLPSGNSFAGGFFGINTATDQSSYVLAAPFDLRDRESYLQLTNIAPENNTLHIQIYNVGNLCNENNFFDVYTPNDTHIYNLRDIITNDGNPSGVDLPEDAYGIVFISTPSPGFIMIGNQDPAPLIGNIRMLDNSGYEYRTNLATSSLIRTPIFLNQERVLSFNYNSEAGIILSDVFGIATSQVILGDDDDDMIGDDFEVEATLDNVIDTFAAFDIDIINNNEVVFSCRDIVFSCVDENNPLIEEILTLASSGEGGFPGRSSASVARFEYGINNALPHSKGGELLCPGNNISEGTVLLRPETGGDRTQRFWGYVGLNNGNGRGSMDTMFFPNQPFGPGFDPGPF